jgi:hypothetical protein
MERLSSKETAANVVSRKRASATTRIAITATAQAPIRRGALSGLDALR